MRTITLFSTKGGSKKIESNATTWGELRREIVNTGYNLDNLQATENIGKTTLIHEDAAIPEGNFVLFLRLIKSKAGAFDPATASYKELKEKAGNDENLKAYLNEFAVKNGKNSWVFLSTALLKQGTAEYLGAPASKPAAKKKSAPKAEEVENVVVTETSSNATESLDSVESTLGSILEVNGDRDDITNVAQSMLDDLATLRQLLSISTEELNNEAELKRLEQEEEDRLRRELRDLESRM